jgi:hypothetical protein
VADTPQEILARAVQALGGTWHTQRAVTVLRAAGTEAVDEHAREKQARHALRRLRDRGILVQTRDRPVEYRPAA